MRRHHVLVVDDDAVRAAATADAVRRRVDGAAVSTAWDGDDAREALADADAAAVVHGPPAVDAPGLREAAPGDRPVVVGDPGGTLVDAAVTGDRRFVARLADRVAGTLAPVTTPVAALGRPTLTTDAAGRVARVEAGAAALLGLDAGRAVGLRPADVGVPAPVRERLAAPERPPVVVTVEGRHVEAVPFETPAGAGCLLRDVTDRVEREATLRRRADRLDEFAGAVAHDLRNPLTVAGGRLELLAEETEVDADDEHLRAVRAALERADDLVDGALRFARESAVDDPEPTDPAAVAERAWSTAATGSARLSVRPVGGVLADPEALRRLFENLFRNAVEHGGDGPTVRVGPCADGDGFYVSDDGPGIAPADRERAFDRSFSSDDGGLGLAVVAAVARAHDWSVRATESESGGARFEVTDVTLAPGAAAPEAGVTGGGAPRPAEE